MAYKLYDFDDPELDEQVRLICDVLYNKREIYPGQLGTIRFPWLEYQWWNHRPTGTARPFTVLTSNMGFSAARTSPGVATDQSVSGEEFVQVQSAVGSVGSFIGSTSSMYATATSIGEVFDVQPYFRTRIKLSSITDIEVFVVLGTVPGSGATANWPWSNTTGTGGVGFVFRPASGATWRVVSKLGTSTSPRSQDIASTVTVTADQIYTLELVTLGTGSAQNTYCYIDGTLVATVAQADYAQGTAVSNNWYVYLVQLLAGTKQLAISEANCGRRITTLPSLAGFNKWVRQ